jgi:hypothetical protein
MKKHTADLAESLGAGARGYRELARLLSADSQFGLLLLGRAKR